MKSRAVCLLAFFLLLAVSATADELYHIVEAGQTLFSISRRYEVSVDAIQDANNISDPTRIRVGMRLTIPVPRETDTYEVQRGDTLFGIARRYGISVNELRELNDMAESDVLRIGRMLQVPLNGTSSRIGRADDSADDRSNDAGRPTEAPSSSAGRADRATPSSAATRSENFWPHPGARENMDGRFRGVAIAGDPGDPVQAVAAGRVVYAGPHSTFGQVIFVQSAAGYIYVYGGNETLHVRVGETVRAGSEIATMGRAPGEDSSRLYFSVWKNNSFIDPNSAPRG